MIDPTKTIEYYGFPSARFASPLNALAALNLAGKERELGLDAYNGDITTDAEFDAGMSSEAAELNELLALTSKADQIGTMAQQVDAYLTQTCQTYYRPDQISRAAGPDPFENFEELLALEFGADAIPPLDYTGELVRENVLREFLYQRYMCLIRLRYLPAFLPGRAVFYFNINGYETTANHSEPEPTAQGAINAMANDTSSPLTPQSVPGAFIQVIGRSVEEGGSGFFASGSHFYFSAEGTEGIFQSTAIHLYLKVNQSGARYWAFDTGLVVGWNHLVAPQSGAWVSVNLVDLKAAGAVGNGGFTVSPFGDNRSVYSFGAMDMKARFKFCTPNY